MYNVIDDIMTCRLSTTSNSYVTKTEPIQEKLGHCEICWANMRFEDSDWLTKLASLDSITVSCETPPF